MITCDEDAAIEARFEPDEAHRLPPEIRGPTRRVRSGSPYYASGSLTIFEESTLEAEPRVEIRMPRGAHLDVRGRLVLEGTPEQPIRLVGETSEPRGAVVGHPGSYLVLKHLTILGGSSRPDPALCLCKAAVSVIGAEISLEEVTILPKVQPFYARDNWVILRNSHLDGKKACDEILSLVGGTALIEGNTCIGNGEMDLDFVERVVIRNNVIRLISQDPNRDGIDIGRSKGVIIEGNRIEDTPDKGISIGASSEVLIRKNVIVQCRMAMAVRLPRSTETPVTSPKSGAIVSRKRPAWKGVRPTSRTRSSRPFPTHS